MRVIFFFFFLVGVTHELFSSSLPSTNLCQRDIAIFEYNNLTKFEKGFPDKRAHYAFFNGKFDNFEQAENALKVRRFIGREQLRQENHREKKNFGGLGLGRALDPGAGKIRAFELFFDSRVHFKEQRLVHLGVIKLLPQILVLRDEAHHELEVFREPRVKVEERALHEMGLDNFQLGSHVPSNLLEVHVGLSRVVQSEVQLDQGDTDRFGEIIILLVPDARISAGDTETLHCLVRKLQRAPVVDHDRCCLRRGKI